MWITCFLFTENTTGSPLEKFRLSIQISEVPNKMVLMQFKNLAKVKVTLKKLLFDLRNSPKKTFFLFLKCVFLQHTTERRTNIPATETRFHKMH